MSAYAKLIKTSCSTSRDNMHMPFLQSDRHYSKTADPAYPAGVPPLMLET